MTGTNNTLVGNQAGLSLTSGYENTVVGSGAASNMSATDAQVVAVGFNAGQNTGSRSTYVGNRSGVSTTGVENSFLGMYSGEASTGGSNTLIGVRAGRNSTGSNNTILGRNAGQLVNGSNVIIGESVAATTFAAASNVLLIDNTDTPTPLVQGNFSTDQFTLNVHPNTDASFLVTGTSGDDNVQMQSLSGVYSADAYGVRANDGIVVADGAGNLRKVALPGSVFYNRLPATTAAGTGVQRTIATVAAPAAGVYEVEVLVMYNGTNPLESFDATITGAASGSWGVVSSGQALEPSNVDAPGGIVAGIGVGSIPASRLTVVLKGIIDVAAPGNITFDALNDIGVFFQQNTYIKLTRLN